MPAYSIRVFARISLIACIMFASTTIAFTGTGNEERSISVSYYDDAAGVFALKSPPSVDGRQLRLTGTCSLPELTLKVQNKSARVPARQAVFRTGGKPSFDFGYVCKDGPGEYEIIVFGKKRIEDLGMRGLCTFSFRLAAGETGRTEGPDISNCVLSYVKSVMGTTVGSGECWDLAQEALDGCGADWNRPRAFGTLLDPVKDEIRPGDIIQFRSVKLVEKLPNGGTRWQVLGMPDHTAIIVEVLGIKNFRLAHQNIGGKRFVITTEVNLNQATSGTYSIYRPVAGITK